MMLLQKHYVTKHLLEDSKLEALRTFTLTIVRNRGHVSQEDLTAFYALVTVSNKY